MKHDDMTESTLIAQLRQKAEMFRTIFDQTLQFIGLMQPDLFSHAKG